MPSSDPVQRFQDILDNIDRIRRFTAGMDERAFAADERAVYAVKHALLIISEAAQKLGPLASELCPSIPWPDIRGLGNHLRHGYDLIDVRRIWFAVERDLLPLERECQNAIRRLHQESAKGTPEGR